MEYLSTLLTAPTSTLLVIAGILFLLLSLVTLKKPIVIELTSGGRITAGIVGGILLILGLALTTVFPSQMPATATAAITATLSSTPTQSLDYTPTPMSTPTSMQAAAALLGKNCFNSKSWQVSYGKDIRPSDKDGCWQLSPWGWSAVDNGFSIFVQKSPAGGLYGVYTPIQPNSDITFNLQIDRLYSIGSGAANMTFGIADVDRPDTGMFLMYNETTDPSISQYQIGSTLTAANVMKRWYQYGTIKQLKFVLEGTTLSIYINGTLLVDPLSVRVSTPAFWIGNLVHMNGDVTVKITDLVITTH